jgi:hypothetical protein
MSEKKKIELATAELFLRLYNDEMKTAFSVVSQNETPDVHCKDRKTGQELELEISLLQNLPGEIAFILGRGNQPRSPTTETTAVSLFDDVYKELEKSLSKKLLSKYSEKTALVLRQTSILWSPEDWKLIARDIRNMVLKEREKNYGKGIWIITWNHKVMPTTQMLYRLSS